MTALPCLQSLALRKEYRTISACIIASLCYVGSAPVCSAQTSDRSRDQFLEEVIVTAQKRVELLREVPVAVSTLDGKSLATSSQLRVEDYFRKLPGVSLTLAGNGGEPLISIRGMVTSNIGNPTAGVVIDEVAYGRSRSLAFPNSVADVDPGDLARVEVLRGPQGTLYGASSIGGLLKYVTIDPSTQGLDGRIQLGSTHVEYGDDLGHSIRGAVNVPLGDTFAVRVSGFTIRDPGYVDNAETGQKDVNNRDSDGGRLSALWQPSENLSLKLNAFMQDTVRAGVADSDITLEPNLQRRQLIGVGGSERETNAYSATLRAMLGPVELVSATGYSIDELHNSIEAVFPPVNTLFPGSGRASLVTAIENEKLTQELRASIPIGDRLTWLVGAFYTEENDETSVDFLANTNDGTVVGLVQRNLLLPATSFEERAAFTNLTIQVTDRFDVQVGGRLSESDQVLARASVLTGANPITAAPNFFQTSRSDDSAFTYLFTPRFKVSQDLMLYARFASGYRIGGPNFNCGLLPTLPCDFDPDTSKNYEIGAKGAFFDNGLSFDASVYYIDWKDIQISGLSIPGASPTITYIGNASRAKSQGVEVSVSSRPLSGMSLSAWVAYNDAVLTEAFPIGNGSTVIPAGRRLPHSAPWTGGLSLDQEFPLRAWTGAKGFAGVDASYTDERYSSLTLVGVRTKPDYIQVDVRAGLIYDSWTVSAFANNVADKRGILRDDGLGGGTLVNYIQPRTIGISLTKDF
jgi:iron complex outermembrane receptor protein